MARVFYLCDVFEFVVYSLDNGSFSQKYSVIHRSQAALHVVFEFGYQLDSVDEQLAEQAFAYIALVTDQLSIYELDKRLHFQRFPVVNISRSDHEVEYLSLVVAYQMQLESVKPAQRAFAALRYSFEHLVHVYPLVAAHTQQGAVNKTYACAFSQQTFLYEDDKLHHNGLLQFREPVVRDSFREQMPVSPAYLVYIKVFETLVVGTVDHYHNDNDFCL